MQRIKVGGLNGADLRDRHNTSAHFALATPNCRQTLGHNCNLAMYLGGKKEIDFHEHLAPSSQKSLQK